jgi:hypothetical protein
MDSPLPVLASRPGLLFIHCVSLLFTLLPFLFTDALLASH